MVGGLVQFAVPVNYNMTDYLPETAPSTVAIEVMNEEFDEAVPNIRVMVRDVTIQEALDYKRQIESIDGVSGMMWLDDVIDIKVPIEMADQDAVESYYKNGNALFSFVVE